MSERDLTRQLNEQFRELLLAKGFKFLSSTNYFKRKVDSNRYECIYFVVQQSKSSEYALKFRFWLVMRDVEKAWSEMVGRKHQRSTFDSTLWELSENFLLKPGTWAVDPQSERLIDEESIRNYIIDIICPWFNSIQSLVDARDWLSDKGKLGGWSWTTMLAMDHMLNDSEHLSRFLNSLAKDIESDANLLQVVSQAYAPFQNFDRTFFRPVVIEQELFLQSKAQLLEDERLGIDARIAKSLSYPDKFHSELYCVYVLLGSSDEVMLRNCEGWMQVLTLMKSLCEGVQKGFMQLGRPSHSDSKVAIDLESDEVLNVAATRAASTIKERGDVRILAQSPDYVQRRKEPPRFFLCCASQIQADLATLKFDPFVLFAVPDSADEKFGSRVEALLRTLRIGVKPKLAAFQKRPFHLQSIVSGSESLIDAPIGIFRPGSRHMDDLDIDMLKGRWTLI